MGSTMAFQTKHGLASVGSTHTGAMQWAHVFETHLKSGKSWGEAGRIWYNLRGWTIDKWHHGIIFYGDPTVRLAGPPRLSNRMGAMSVPEKEDSDEEPSVEDASR